MINNNKNFGEIYINIISFESRADLIVNFIIIRKIKIYNFLQNLDLIPR